MKAHKPPARTARRRPGVVLAAIWIGMAAVRASGQIEEWSDGIAARVNGEAITFSDLRESALNLEIPLSALTSEAMRGEGFRKVITFLIDEMLLVQEATLEEIQVDESELARRVNESLQGLVEQLGGEAEFNRYITSKQLTLESLRRALTRQERRQELSARLISQRVQVSKAEVDRFRRERQEAGKPQEEVRLAQILILCPAEQQKSDLGRDQYNKALQIAREAGHDGEDFFRLARERSEDPAGRSRDGLLGWLDPRILKPPLSKRIALMHQGEVSEPVAAEDGFHIIKLLGRHTARDLLYAVKFREERTKLLETLRKNAVIESDLFSSTHDKSAVD